MTCFDSDKRAFGLGCGRESVLCRVNGEDSNATELRVLPCGSAFNVREPHVSEHTSPQERQRV